MEVGGVRDPKLHMQNQFFLVEEILVTFKPSSRHLGILMQCNGAALSRVTVPHRFGGGDRQHESTVLKECVSHPTTMASQGAHATVLGSDMLRMPWVHIPLLQHTRETYAAKHLPTPAKPDGDYNITAYS